MIVRQPRGSLRPFIERVWSSGPEDGDAKVERERMVPTGAMHLAIRLSDDPIRVFEREDAEGTCFGYEVIGGARSRYCVKDVRHRGRAVGAVLAPGASLPLLGAPAEAFSERHVALADVWGRGAAELREQLRETAPERQLARFEELLAARLPRVRGLHPAVAHAIARLGDGEDIAEIVDETGYSHRRFLTLFRESVGLAPKRYGRVRRVTRVLEELRLTPSASWAQLAAAAGYADQAHLTRELSEIAGVTPGEYRRVAPLHAHHVPLRR